MSGAENFLGKGILCPNFLATFNFPKILPDLLISYRELHFFTSKTKGVKFSDVMKFILRRHFT